MKWLTERQKSSATEQKITDISILSTQEMTITLFDELVNYYADYNDIITVLDVFPTVLFNLVQ